MITFRGAGLIWSALLFPLSAFSATPSLLSYATYLGSPSPNGSSANATWASAIAIDPAGNAYLGGNGFALKLNPTGTQILYSVTLAGDEIAAVALDAGGNLIIGGATATGGFVGKLDPTGKTLFLNTLASAVNALALDAAAGNIYVTGATAPTAARGTDAFVIKFSPTGTQVYSTTIGGTGDDVGNGIAVDAQGDAFIAGETLSPDFPVSQGAAQTTFSGVETGFGYGSFGDGFVAKLNAAGSGVLFATYWGGAGAPNVPNAIALDAAGNAYVTGSTAAAGFPVSTGAFQSTYAGPAADPTAPDPDGDVFITKFHATGFVMWSTLLGGSQDDVAYAIALDAAGNVYVAGTTESTDFPPAGASIPSCRKTGGPFVAELDPTGSNLLHSTGMSGMGYDNALALAVSSAGVVYIAGETESQVFFATPGAAQAAYGGSDGSYQAFAANINFSAPASTYTACVLNAASFNPGNEASFPLGTVAPGEIVSLFGTGLGPGSPTVSFDGIPAPITYSGATQINAIVPYGLKSSTTQMTVQFGGQSYGPVAMPVAAAVPGIFTYNGSGTGEAAVINQDGSFNSVSNPAPVGSIITFFACGAGLMNPPAADGSISANSLPLPQPVLPVTVTIRGVPATVITYAGAAPGFVSGLLQIDVQVPSGINFGNEVPLTLSIGGFNSQLDITIAVSLQ